MNTELPDVIVERFLRSLRNQFYKGVDKLFFQEKPLLIQAICYPARWLDERAVRLNSKRYTTILTTIIRTINAHGNLGKVRSMGRYLLHCVQLHMQHHGEDYYEQGKAIRNALEDVMLGVQRARSTRGPLPADDTTVPDLAKVHRVLSSSKKTRRKATETPLQPDLFNSAKLVKRQKTTQPPKNAARKTN